MSTIDGKKRAIVDASSLFESPPDKKRPRVEAGTQKAPGSNKRRCGPVELRVDEFIEPSEVHQQVSFNLVAFVKHFIGRHESVPARGQTRLVYVVTDCDGNSPRTLFINRANFKSLPPAGEEAHYVDHMVLVANAKVYEGAMTSFHEGSPFAFLSPTGQPYHFGVSSDEMPPPDSDTVATIALGAELVGHILDMFPEAQTSDVCTAGDEWMPFEYPNSDGLVRFSLNTSTLRWGVERRYQGLPVLTWSDQFDCVVYCARIKSVEGLSVVIEDDGKLSNTCAPRRDDPVGLVGFRRFVDKVLGIGSCKCSRCSIYKVERANPLHIAVQCTVVKYNYEAYGRVKSEKIVRVNLGQPLF